MNVAAALCVLGLGAAQIGDMALPSDPRIRTVTYSAGQVITLPVAMGYAAVVELGGDERVDSVVVGNSAVWQVTASRRGDSVVVKPMSGAATTDMVVITAEHRYVFLLQPAQGDGAPFVLRFVHPDAQAIAASTQLPTLAAFRFSGTRALFPASMHDDGQRTTVNWGRDTALPAVFAVERDGHEAIVNGRMVGSDYVIERIAARFVFRQGRQHAAAVRRPIGAR